MSAVADLGDVPGDEATRRLVEIAVSPSTINGSIRAVAIRHLAERGADESAGDRLVVLLEPAVNAELRVGVGQALLSLGCRTDCLVGVIRFLKIRHEGQLTAQERLVAEALKKLGPEWIGDVGGQISESEAEVIDLLERVLAADPEAFVAVAEEHYSYGSSAQGEFIADLVTSVLAASGAANDGGDSIE